MAIGGVKLQKEALKQMAPATTYVDQIYIHPETVTVVDVPASAKAVSIGYELPGVWAIFGDAAVLSETPPSFPGATSITDGTGWAYSPTARTIDSSISMIALYSTNASVMHVSFEWYLG